MQSCVYVVVFVFMLQLDEERRGFYMWEDVLQKLFLLFLLQNVLEFAQG